MKEGMSGDSAFGEIRTVSSISQAVSVLNTFEPDVVIAGARLFGGSAASLIEAAGIPLVALVRPDEDAVSVRGMEADDLVQLPGDQDRKSWRAFCSEACVKAKIAVASAIPAGAHAPKAKAPPPPAKPERVILIGASTGGTDATAEILKRLPDGLPGIVIVQHMPSGFTKMYAQRLNGISGIRVSEARDGDRVGRGSALIAPGGLHLMLKKDRAGYYVKCVRGERVNGHCPSVGVLFDSAAETAGPEAVGVLLTGMGRDGAEGLLRMREAGAYTIGQDEATCVVYGMPMAAFEIGAVVKQAPLQQIADLIVLHTK
ncbi:CheB methylesterase domain-containing protein [Caproicibacter sp. BJN0012]|uniref:CheB methylesterase domain-containing protein n=1 Tax=Caproicibacter sp. BJN0012 TaxID=3110227 RepID=UPI002E1266FF